MTFIFQQIPRKMPRKRKISVQEAACLVINSRNRAELFIASYMDRSQATREEAIKKLRELGIDISTLPE